MKERLFKLIKEVPEYIDDEFDGTEYWLRIADHLIANGVIVPPCKVGDKVYQTDGIRIYESTVNEATYTASKVIYCTENICFDETAIGESIFLTREEAEQALKGGEEQ